MEAPLTIEDWARINHCLLRLYRELDGERHTRVMLEVLNECVPSDSVVLNVFTPPDQLSCVTRPEHLATPEQIALVGKYGFQSPYGSYYLATEDASWKRTTDFMPAEEFQKTDLHRMALAPLGINYQIGGMLAVLGASAHVITVHRTHHNFTEREREILNALHPHLVTSYLNAFALRRANRSVTELKAVMETAPGAYGYFYSDTSPAWLQPRTREWLVEFFPDEAKDALNIPLYLLAQLRQSRDEGGTPKSFSRPSGTETLTGILAQSPLGGWILRLERKPKSPPPRFRALCQLTARENDVLRWMVEGKRNAEIAKILGTSSRTVEKQVEAILAKLAVENRATAILRAMELAAATQQNGAGI